MGLTAFDLVAGAVLLISGLIGLGRGAAREVTGAFAFVLALVVAFTGLRVTAPLFAHVFSTPWLCKWAAVFAGFIVAYVLLRIILGALTRGVRSAGFSSLDKALGAGVGLARGVVVVGLAMLLIDTVAPPEHAPVWLAGSRLYPLAEASGAVLRQLAPAGGRLAGMILPRESQEESKAGGGEARRGLAVLVEKTP